MIIWTPAVLSVLYVCVQYFCIYTCSAQLNMFHMEMRSRNTLIIIIIKFDFEFLSQNRNTKNCPCRSVFDVHCACR